MAILSSWRAWLAGAGAVRSSPQSARRKSQMLSHAQALQDKDDLMFLSSVSHKKKPQMTPY
eukprot:1185585-Amphidinium_carterae.1